MTKFIILTQITKPDIGKQAASSNLLMTEVLKATVEIV